MFYFCITLGETLIEKEMKVGPKGQVAIPRTMRKALKIEPGSKVLFTLEDDQLVLRKAEEISIEEIAEKVEGKTEENCVDVDKLLDEAIEWARRSK